MFSVNRAIGLNSVVADTPYKSTVQKDNQRGKHNNA
jgi:hypothetical protein